MSSVKTEEMRFVKRTTQVQEQNQVRCKENRFVKTKTHFYARNIPAVRPKLIIVVFLRMSSQFGLSIRSFRAVGQFVANSWRQFGFNEGGIDERLGFS